ncbi:MAG: hypothetical protein QOD99_2917 [Chthoniobacter sp.]|nr:hypothetical protein [Chthoniobacter sp.]
MPVLSGAAGLLHLREFLAWINEIGASIDQSCGLHISIGIESVIGSRDSGMVSEYVRKVAHIAQWHAMSLYGQTGTGRHLNRYSHTLSASG